METKRPSPSQLLRDLQTHLDEQRARLEELTVMFHRPTDQITWRELYESGEKAIAKLEKDAASFEMRGKPAAAAYCRSLIKSRRLLMEFALMAEGVSERRRRGRCQA